MYAKISFRFQILALDADGLFSVIYIPSDFDFTQPYIHI